MNWMVYRHGPMWFAQELSACSMWLAEGSLRLEIPRDEEHVHWPEEFAFFDSPVDAIEHLTKKEIEKEMRL